MELVDVAEGAHLDSASFDGVIAGGSLHAGRHQRELVGWAKRNCAALSGMPSAFFSVSLSAAEDTDEAREDAERCIEEFLAETGWSPALTASIAGALQYRAYGVLLRTLMRLKMRRGGHPTDTSRDHEFTDWAAVESFAGEFSELSSTEFAHGPSPA